MDYEVILNQISFAYKEILKDNLTGIYVHGSIAFGCFDWNRSDIDFIVVTKESPSQQKKAALIKALLSLEKSSPPRGIEMSVVLEKNCRNFIYPTPFELHFSNAHIEKCKNNLKKYCTEMTGNDKDLAAHFTVIKSLGIVLYGKDIEQVFGDVPKSYYVDSIKCDVSDAENEIINNPVYIVLNLCRVMAYIQDGLIISKIQGGLWGIENLPLIYTPVIEMAIKSYSSNKTFSADYKLTENFYRHLINRLEV